MLELIVDKLKLIFTLSCSTFNRPYSNVDELVKIKS